MKYCGNDGQYCACGGSHDPSAINAYIAKLEHDLSSQRRWVEGALGDYAKLKKALNDRGIMQWEDTVTAILGLLEDKP